MGQTIVEKISQTHMGEGPSHPLRAGDFLSIRPDHVMTHDNTSAVMKKFRTIGAQAIHDPAQPVFTADHNIQNTEESNLAKYRSMEAFAAARDRLLSARHRHWPPDHGGEGICAARRFRGGVGFALQYVRRAGRRGNTSRAHGRGCNLGDGRILVADSAEHSSRAGRQTRDRRDRQRCDHHPMRSVQPGRSAECGARVRRAGSGVPQHGCSTQHCEHDHRMGRAGGLVPGGRCDLVLH